MGDTASIGNYTGKTVHMVGIGGSSMSGLALLLKWRGCVVRGSDRDASYTTDNLCSMGIPVTIGHYENSVHGADLVVYSAAIDKDVPERAEAARLGIPQMERSELLGQIGDSYGQSVAVAGTHGKTTVTSMLAQTLTACGLDPNVHIGGVLDAIGGSVRTGNSDLFVTEADEFARSFLKLSPTIAIILNIDADHLDIYKDIDEIEETFLQFAGRLQNDGVIIGCGDDERVTRVLTLSGKRYVTFGMADGCDCRITELCDDETLNYSFTIREKCGASARLRLKVPGMHSVLDAAAAYACLRRLGVGPDDAARALGEYKGAHRRFELTGNVLGVALYHDYGHNPGEYKTVVPIAARLAKSRQGRLFTVFQPHTYSRAKALIDGFGPSFAGSDEVLVTDIYAAREKDPGDIHSRMLIEKMQGFGYRTVYCPDFAACERYLISNWRDGDVVLTVGCGNIYLLNDILAKAGGEPRG